LSDFFMSWSDEAPLPTPCPESWADSVRGYVRRFEASLMLYALRLLKDPEEAQDVVQETFLRLCAQEPARLEGRISVWLFSVCRNICMDIRRKKIRAAAAGKDLSILGAPGNPEPDLLAEQDENFSQALAVIEKLSQNQQEVLRLKFQHGLSYREIAEVTGLTVTNVGFLIHAGLKKIREQLAQPQS
jgi:RNA polymerase sigma-70 factor (ECF subfamily)